MIINHLASLRRAQGWPHFEHSPKDYNDKSASWPSQRTVSLKFCRSRMNILIMRFSNMPNCFALAFCCVAHLRVRSCWTVFAL